MKTTASDGSLTAGQIERLPGFSHVSTIGKRAWNTLEIFNSVDIALTDESFGHTYSLYRFIKILLSVEFLNYCNEICFELTTIISSIVCWNTTQTQVLTLLVHLRTYMFQHTNQRTWFKIRIGLQQIFFSLIKCVCELGRCTCNGINEVLFFLC